MNGHADCPHCGEGLSPVKTPPESTWGGEIHYVCFNDDCGYFASSWDTLSSQGVNGTGYRCRFDARGACIPAPVWSKDAMKDQVMSQDQEEGASLYHFTEDALARDDETPDSEFYTRPRYVDHLDSVALETVESLYGRLAEPGSRILDLMAGPDSHLRKTRSPAKIVGLGLNQEELGANDMLNESVVHDLNADPTLPFEDNAFDLVVNTVSVDYLSRPLEVFQEVARTLKPGGRFVVVFSNRMFPPKAVNIWKSSNERQRVNLVRKYFTLSGSFRISGYQESVGRPRPKDDKYYDRGIPSDPVYAVWGETVG